MGLRRKVKVGKGYRLMMGNTPFGDTKFPITVSERGQVVMELEAYDLYEADATRMSRLTGTGQCWMLDRVEGDERTRLVHSGLPSEFRSLKHVVEWLERA